MNGPLNRLPAPVYNYKPFGKEVLEDQGRDGYCNRQTVPNIWKCRRGRRKGLIVSTFYKIK